MYTAISYSVKIKTLRSIFLLLSVFALGQTTVSSIPELKSYLNENNANIKMTPGVYRIGLNDIDSGLFTSPVLLEIKGSNNIFDFEGVTIEFDTNIFQSFGRVEVIELRIVGDANVVKNLKMEDIGTVTPIKTALGIQLDGIGNRIENIHMTVRGSEPYGYGDLFGKGGQNTVIFHRKHAAILVRGENNHVKNCTVIHRAYGHGIFVQGGKDVLIEGCYIEGDILRTTDDVLLEEGTGTRADDVDFMTTWGYRVPPGYMISKQEDGIRAYRTGPHYLTGETTYTENMRVINCTVKRMRSGFPMVFAGGVKYVENCTSIENETGFSIGSNGEIINSRSDAKYGPVFANAYSSDKNSDIDITVLSSDNGYGSHPLAYIGGNNHNITLRNSETNPNQNLRVMLSGDRTSLRHLNGANPSQNNLTSSGIEINNLTNFPIVLHTDSKDCIGTSGGSITDQGTNNKIDKIDINNGGGCTDNPSINVPSGLESGINYRYYEGSWNSLPNFETLTPITEGFTSVIDLSKSLKNDNFGFVFSGYINIPEDGSYTFYTTSDDGSNLYIDDEKIVDNDGLHGVREESGIVCLESGYHKIEIQYFEKTGGNVLSVAYAGPNFSKTIISNLFGIPENSTTCTLPWTDNDFTIIKNTVNYSSGAIDISCESSVSISLAIKGEGPMETADFLNVYYKVNGGSEKVISENRGSFSLKNISVSELNGNTLELIINGYTSYADETYTVSNILVSSNTPPSFSKIEAEDYDSMSGIQTEACIEGTDNIGWIHNGDWSRYDDIDLTGAKSISIRVACAFSGGTIEVRSDSANGKLLATLPIQNTGGNQVWTTLDTDITAINGIHDIYLMYKGGNGYLFNVNWLKFSSDIKSPVDTIDKEIEPITLYPNPASELIYLENGRKAIIEIYDSLGKKMLTKTIQNTKEPIEIGTLVKGIYFMKINQNGSITYRQISKK